MSVTRKGRRILAATAASALLAGSMMAVSTTSVSAADKTGGTLLFVTYADQLDHIDPARVYTGRDIAFLNTYLFRNLVMYKPVPGSAGASLVPDLATNTGVPSNNAKTWKFTLRPGTTWQDGSAITCADVKYGVSRVYAQDVITDGPQYAVTMLNIPKDADGSSAYKGPYKGTGQALYNKAVTCKGNTITFNLSRSVADFNYALTYPAFAPVKKSKDTGDKYDLKPFASGPYKIASYKIGDALTLTRNSKWKQSSDTVRKPYPDTVELRFGVAQEVRDQIFLQDSIPNAINFDGGMLPTNIRKFFADDSTKNRRLNVYDPYVRYAAMNVSKVNCLEVRQAVFFGINTQALIDLSGGSVFYGDPGDNPVKPVLGVDYTKTTGNIHDPAWSINGAPAKAKALIAAAKAKGGACADLAARATDPDRGLIWDIAISATNQKAAVLITNALKDAGIVMKFNFIPSGQYYSTVQDITKEDDIASAGWGADWANASTVLPELFTKEGGFNLSVNWNDPAYAAFKALMVKGLNETNRAKQAAIWKQGSQYVMDQYWIIRPVFSKTQFAWGSGVGGVGYWEPQGNYLFPSMYIKQ
jgi:peptide/nickel transport system substrate-binding protein